MHEEGEWGWEWEIGRWKCQARASPYEAQLCILNLDLCASSLGKQGGDEAKNEFCVVC
jgi:hypothetical protein